MAAIDPSLRQATAERSNAGIWSLLLLIISTVLAFLLSFRFDNPPAGYDIDPSWAGVVAWASEHGKQWGLDIVFTYGPLGFLSPYFSYRGSMIDTAAAAQIGFAALYAFVFAQAAMALPVLARAILLAVLLGFGATWAGDVAWLTLYPLALLAVWRLRDRNTWKTRIIAIAIGATCAVPWLAKFSLFPLWLLWLACVPLVTRKHNRAGIIAALASLIASALLWHVAGQQFDNFWPYLQSSWQVAVGYPGAMQWRGSSFADAVGLAVLLIALSTQCILLARAPMALSQRLAMLALTAACTVLAFKAAYTRADAFHLPIFYATCAIATLVAAALRGQGDDAARSGSWVALLCAVSVLLLYPVNARILLMSKPPGLAVAEQRWRSLKHFQRRQDELEEMARSARHSLDLPNMRQAVGRAPIDIVSIGQGVLLLNDMNYRPRPVFQGYSAYTPELARMNSAFLASPRAPDWVLMDMSAIDGRYPTSDDPQAVLQLLRAYRPFAWERGLVLMRRHTSAVTPAAAGIEIQGRIGEFVAVPELQSDGVEVRIQVEPTGWMRLASATMRASQMFIDVELESGRGYSYRLIPGAAEAGFLLSPMIADPQQLWSWLGGNPADRVIRFRLRSDAWLGQPTTQEIYRVRYLPVHLAKP